MHTTHHHAHRAGLTAPELAHLYRAGLARLGAPDAAPVQLAPTPESETARVASASRIEEQGKTDSADFAGSLAADQAGGAAGEDFATQRVRLARADDALSRSNAGICVITCHVRCWGLVRTLRDLAAVVNFLEQPGGAYA